MKKIRASLFRRASRQISRARMSMQRDTFLGVLYKEFERAFDPVFYLDRNDDVEDSGMDPFVHFLGFGFEEGRDPSARVSNHSLRKNIHAILLPASLGDLTERSSTTAASASFADFVQSLDVQQKIHAAYKRAAQEFDAEYYLSKHTDVANSGRDPFVHFLRDGQREQRQPSEDVTSEEFFTRHGLLGSVVGDRAIGTPLLTEVASKETPSPRKSDASAQVHLEYRREIEASGFWDERRYLSLHSRDFLLWRSTQLQPVDALDHWIMEGCLPIHSHDWQ